MGTHWLVMDNSEDAGRAPYRARLAAAGRPLPDTRLTTEELMSTTRHNTHIDLERLTGIHERRVSVGDEDSYSLAVKAARNCLEKAQRDGSSLDVVTSCSITKLHGGLTQWLEPTMSGAVARAIGAPNAMTFDVSNACAGMLTGVTILNNWIRQGIVERGLVVSGEYISQLSHNAARHIRTIMSKELACLTLGDAGAPLLRDRADAHSGGISLAGFTTIADHSRLCVAYPKGRELGSAGVAAGGPRRGRDSDPRHRPCDHPPNVGPRNTQGHGPDVGCVQRQSAARRGHHRRPLREHGVDDAHRGAGRRTRGRPDSAGRNDRTDRIGFRPGDRCCSGDGGRGSGETLWAQSLIGATSPGAEGAPGIPRRAFPSRPPRRAWRKLSETPPTLIC